VPVIVAMAKGNGGGTGGAGLGLCLRERTEIAEEAGQKPQGKCGVEPTCRKIVGFPGRGKLEAWVKVKVPSQEHLPAGGKSRLDGARESRGRVKLPGTPRMLLQQNVGGGKGDAEGKPIQQGIHRQPETCLWED